jgi:hypothetical protein
MAGSAISNELFDSEFAPMESGIARGGKERWRPQVVRNIHAMSPKEFQTYLEKLREKRPAFIEFLRKKAETDPRMENRSIFQLAQQQRNHHAEFITQETSKAVNSMDSRVIDPVPHKTGGALYSHPSLLQTFLTTKPQPGRILADGRRIARIPDTYITSFAGMTRKVMRKHVSGMQRMNWSNPGEDSRAVSQFRVESAKFWALPRVVGKNRHGLKGVKSGVMLRDVPSKPDFGRSNSYMPGSLAYVSASPAPQGMKGDRHASLNVAAPHRAQSFAPVATTQHETVALLKRLIERKSNAADGDPYPNDV